MNTRTAEIAALCREEVREASWNAIELALCINRGGHEPAELKRLIKLLQEDVDRMGNCADLLQEAKFEREESLNDEHSLMDRVLEEEYERGVRA
jgi:hypothetical protein